MKIETIYATIKYIYFFIWNMSQETINPNDDLFEEESEKQEKVSGNIFEEFAGDSWLNQEVKDIEELQKKDIFFYFQKSSQVMKVINTIFFLGLVVFILYIQLQNSQTLKSYPYLSPVCSIFLSDAAPADGLCYPVTAYLESKNKELTSQKDAQISLISQTIGDVYEMQNLIYSKKVAFLLDRWKNRLKPTVILSEFDTLKNTFEPIDKSKIECSDIIINEKNELFADCTAYSSDWNTDVIELSEGSVSDTQKRGTSISIASSFINFLEQYGSSKFDLLEKQKVFFTESVTGKGTFTKKTSFKIHLKYNSDDSFIY